MKKIILMALVLSSAAFTTLQAQENQAAPTEAKPTPAQQYQQQKDRLQLTKDQQTPYREITKRYAEELRQLKGSSLTPEEKRQKTTIIFSNKDAEMKTLLSAEQFKVYQQIQEERKARFVQLRK